MKEPVEQPKILCLDCGIELDIENYQRRVLRKSENAQLCEDCRDYGKPISKYYTWKHPVLGRIICRPHKGEVDDDFNPIRDGKPYMPGERLCGLRDCVKREHILRVRKPVKLVADPVETVLALVEAQSYTKRKTPASVDADRGILRGGQ